MASTSEKTHAKNLENTHIANTVVASLGATYNPNNPLIKKTALEDFEQAFAARMQAVNAAAAVEQTATDAQITAFKEVPSRVARVIKAARGLGLAPEYLENLRQTANRLSGVRASEKTPDDPATPEDESKSNASVSHRSYAGILETLDLLDEQLKSNPAYEPNEVEYQPAAVTAWITDLRAKRDAALNAKIATAAARNDRDSHVYHPTTGLVTRMNALKAYAETILPKTDTRFKQLKSLKFKDYSK
jgi:hypothetical protein